MTDDELLAAIAEWETGRAARWARIELLKGSEHLAARGEYMQAKAAHDEMKAEATRRKLRGGQGAGRRAAPGPVEQIWCKVQPGDRLVTAKAAARARHMAAATGDLRTRLQRGIGGMKIDDGELLCGRFLGPIDDDPWGETDVENLVLTNVEIPAEPLAGGFAFEHDPRPPDDCVCGYKYAPVDRAAPFAIWRPGDLVTRWQPFELEHGLTAPAIWWQARTGRGNDPPAGRPAPERLMVRIDVTAPLQLTLEQIKAVTDGVRPRPSGCRKRPSATSGSSWTGCGWQASLANRAKWSVCSVTQRARCSASAGA